MKLSRIGIILVVILAAAAVTWLQPGDEPPQTTTVVEGPAVETLFADRTSGVMVEVAGQVDRLLSDDREGSQHQRFVLALPSGHTLLIAHNIDLAERVPVERGDRVEVRGQYEWNERGGVLHWTHHDPGGDRPGGWIRHLEQTYR